MYKPAMTLSTLLLVGLTAGCFADPASGTVKPSQADSTQPSKTPPDVALPETTVPDTELPDTERPDTAQPDPTPADTSASETPASDTPASDTTASDTTASDTTASDTTSADDTATDAAASTPDDSLADQTLAVETATQQFYDSLNQLFKGNALGMDRIWSHTDKVTYMGPGGGIATGWDEVQALWDEQAKMKLGGHIDPEELHVTVGADLAIVECYEVGSNRDALGAPLPVRIRATNSFRKEAGKWKMIGHHTDLLPYLAGPLGPTGRPSSANLSDPGDPADTDSITVKDDEVQLKLED